MYHYVKCKLITKEKINEVIDIELKETGFYPLMDSYRNKIMSIISDGNKSGSKLRYKAFKLTMEGYIVKTVKNMTEDDILKYALENMYLTFRGHTTDDLLKILTINEIINDMLRMIVRRKIKDIGDSLNSQFKILISVI